MVIILFVGLFGSVQSQVIPEVDFEGFEPLLHQADDTTYVLNFWATWCKPCVDELPHFVKAASEFKDQKVKFVFVSLDLPGQDQDKLISFVKNHQMEGMVLLLNDPDSNSWIPKVDAQWSGVIPATLIYRGADKSFFKGFLSYEHLVKTIKSKQL